MSRLPATGSTRRPHRILHATVPARAFLRLGNELQAAFGAELPVLGFGAEHDEHAFNLGTGIQMPHQLHLVGQIIDVVVIGTALDFEDENLGADNEYIHFPFLAGTVHGAIWIADLLPEFDVFGPDILTGKTIAEGACHDIFEPFARARLESANVEFHPVAKAPHFRCELLESPIHLIEPLIHLCESLIHLFESLIYSIEPPIHLFESLIHLTELILVFLAGHLDLVEKAGEFVAARKFVAQNAFDEEDKLRILLEHVREFPEHELLDSFQFFRSHAENLQRFGPKGKEQSGRRIMRWIHRLMPGISHFCFLLSAFPIFFLGQAAALGRLRNFPQNQSAHR
jgi:hypothetical protein